MEIQLLMNYFIVVVLGTKHLVGNSMSDHQLP